MSGGVQSGRRDHVRRICVVRFGGMGDILLATPAVRALHQHFGTSEIDFIVGRGMGDALTGIGYLRQIISFDKNGNDGKFPNLLRFLRRLRAERYDLFVNFHPSAKTYLMALTVLFGGGRILTFHKDRRKQPDTNRVRHAVDDFTKELRPLGIGPVTDRRMDFVIPTEARECVACLLSDAGIAPTDLVLVANPAATRIINRWPPERFVELLNALSRDLPHLRVVLSGGPGDVELVNTIATQTEASVTNLAGQLTVKELGALLARANIVVTGDTGPMHIASAVGAPLVVLSGAADPDRTGPLTPGDLVVINRDLRCVPCQGRTCKRGDIACMTRMPVAQVLRAIKRRLRVGNVGSGRDRVESVGIEEIAKAV